MWVNNCPSPEARQKDKVSVIDMIAKTEHRCLQHSDGSGTIHLSEVNVLKLRTALDHSK